MSELYTNFQGYLRLNIPKIKWIVLFGLLFFVLFLIIKRKAYVKRYKRRITELYFGILLSINCSFIFVMTLFGRTVDLTRDSRVQLFESYITSFARSDMELVLQILMNIVMYIPFGFLLPCCFEVFEKNRHVIFVAFACSGVIELVQWLFSIGYFELDDIMNNVLGATVGVLVYKLAMKAREQYHRGKYGEKETFQVH